MKKIFLILTIVFTSMQQTYCVKKRPFYAIYIEGISTDLYDAITDDTIKQVKKIIKKAKKHGIFSDIISKNCVLETLPLHYAIHMERLDIVKVLLNNMSYLDQIQIDSHRRTSMDFALYCKNSKILDYIISEKKCGELSYEQFKKCALEIVCQNNYLNKKALQKIMHSDKISFETHQSFRKILPLLGPIQRYRIFKEDILQPMESKDFDGFNTPQLKTMTPRLFLEQRSSCCDYDIVLFLNCEVF